MLSILIKINLIDSDPAEMNFFLKPDRGNQRQLNLSKARNMEFVALLCPQCGGLLPRQARWRMVICPYCSNNVTRSDAVVESALYHKAWADAQAAVKSIGYSVIISGTPFRIIMPLGGGEISEVYLAERMNIFPERVILKIAKQGSRPGGLIDEFKNLQELQVIKSSGSAYFSQRLPQAVSSGNTEDTRQEALVLRQPVGFWGSLEDVSKNYPHGIDPRHAVWMWRRVLEVLGYIHDNGWSHCDLHPGHLLVHPEDHGILIISWRKAQKISKKKDGIILDLKGSAWSIRSMLSGDADEPGYGIKTPEPLAELLKKVSEDDGWCSSAGAAGIDEALKDVALKIYGQPSFVPFYPIPAKK